MLDQNRSIRLRPNDVRRFLLRPKGPGLEDSGTSSSSADRSFAQMTYVTGLKTTKPQEPAPSPQCSAIYLAQIEGRCHRDGEEAMIFYAYAEATVEEAIAATVTRRMASMEAMAGEDTSLLDEIADVLADHFTMR